MVVVSAETSEVWRGGSSLALQAGADPINTTSCHTRGALSCETCHCVEGVVLGRTGVCARKRMGVVEEGTTR